MIGTGLHSRNAFTTSIPSMSGRPRSRSRTLGFSVAARRIPVWPSPASSRSNTLGSRLARRKRRIATSSSMTRILVRLPTRHLRGVDGFGKLDEEHGAGAVVAVFGPNPAVVKLHDRAGDGKTQAEAACFFAAATK